MNNSLYQINITKPKCFHKKDGMIIIDDLSSGGILSFSWPDITQDAILTDSGRSVSNLSCGLYTLKIYNILNKTNETLILDLSCPDELSIDMIHIDELKCYNDNLNMLIEWSGGLSPYTLKINDYQITLSDNFYNFQTKPNTYHSIILIDANGCSARRDDIHIDALPLMADVRWEPITEYDGTSDEVSCIIHGGKPPYKTAWFIANNTTPIIVNQTSIKNIIKANDYELVVIDSNDCKFSRTFTISQPQPISVNILSFNDYSTKSMFPASDTELVYNLLLIPDNKLFKTKSILDAAKISIIYNKIDTEQRLCMDYGDIVIDNQKYQYYYLSPGIPNTKLLSLKLIIDDKEYELDYKFGSSRAKLIKGSLLIRDDHGFAFHNNDIIRITNNTNHIDAQIDQIYIKNGWYISNNIYTIINSLNADVLTFINTNDVGTVQSLTTKSNTRLGSIICNVSNGDKTSLCAKLINQYGDSYEYSFDNKYILNINNLKYGQYKLMIQDQYSQATIYNNRPIQDPDNYFTINILDSYEEERNIASIQSANIFNIDPALLNTYNNRPNKLLFSDPEFKNGVLMNISPLDCCYHIVGSDTEIEDCGYKIIDLPHGKYNIKIYKEGYKTQNIKLFYNTHKELVTVILEKEDYNG